MDSSEKEACREKNRAKSCYEFTTKSKKNGQHCNKKFKSSSGDSCLDHCISKFQSRIKEGLYYTGCIKKMVIKLWSALACSLYNLQKSFFHSRKDQAFSFRMSPFL